MNKPAELKLETVPCWIGGKRLLGGNRFGEVYNPATGQVTKRVVFSDANLVDAAVRAACRVCGGAMRIIACIEDPVVIEKILAHLDAKAAAAQAAPAAAVPGTAGAVVRLRRAPQSGTFTRYPGFPLLRRSTRGLGRGSAARKGRHGPDRGDGQLVLKEKTRRRPHHPLAVPSIVHSYRWFGLAHTAWLQSMGIGAHAARYPQPEDRSLAWACFARLSHWEVAASGRKIVGLSQARRRSGVLFSSAALIAAPPWELLRAVLDMPREHATTLADRTVSYAEITGHLPAPETLARPLLARLLKCMRIDRNQAASHVEVHSLPIP